MNLIYFVVVYVAVATSVGGECVLGHEACTFVRSLIVKYQPLPDSSILKSVPDEIKKLLPPVTELTTQGALDCFDTICSPGKTPNFCYLLYIPAYADESRCKDILELYRNSTYVKRPRPPEYINLIESVWNEPKRLENIIYQLNIDAEKHCLNLQEFNQRAICDPVETEYVRVFNESGQLPIAAHSIWPEVVVLVGPIAVRYFATIYSICIRSLLNKVATNFGVPSVITNDGEWLVEGDF